MFDLVVPVYNSIHHVRACLQSIAQYSTLPYHLYICDDASDQKTKDELQKLSELFPAGRCTIASRPQNLGYLRNCNAGISAGNQKYVILINSDTLVTPGYLERVRDGFEANPNVGVISAVSTWANWTRIPFPNGFSYLDLAELIANDPENQIVDIQNASGFFFAVPRAVYEREGLFDEAYHPGYWEEADFCMRLISRGYRVVVDQGLYIFHYGWGSFGMENRNAHMSRNEAIFKERWQDLYASIKAAWLANDPLKDQKDRLNQSDLWKRAKNLNSVAEELSLSPDETQLLLNYLIAAGETAANEIESLRPATSLVGERSEEIIYILPAAMLYGGVLSVFQIVNELVLRGEKAALAIYGPVKDTVYRSFPMFFRPYVFESQAQLVAEFPNCKKVVATHWESAFATYLISTTRNIPCAYFVQDFEPDFYSVHQETQKRRALHSYSLIPNRIVKSEWLSNKISYFPGNVEKIDIGLNLDIFYDRGKPRRRQLLGFARPSSNYRNYPMLKQLYARIHEIDPEIELAVFGIGHSPDDFSVPIRDYGKLEAMSEVARALNESSIFVDCSIFQGFGRPGLEAMACGTAAVLTQEGGITEYAKHGMNCMLIDPNNLEMITSTVMALFENEVKRNELVRQGRKTAAEYCHRKESVRTLEYLRAIEVESRKKPEPPVLIRLADAERQGAENPESDIELSNEIRLAISS